MVEVVNRNNNNIKKNKSVLRINLPYSSVSWILEHPGNWIGTVLHKCDSSEDVETTPSSVSLSTMSSDPWTSRMTCLCTQFSEPYDSSWSPSLHRAILCECVSTVSDALLALIWNGGLVQ